MSETPSLGLPLFAAEQAQKHVTHNEALSALDAIVQLAVKDRGLAAPPGSPAAGDRYIVAAGASGAWAGHESEIAAWQNGAWEFYAPREGWRAWVDDENLLLVHDGADWADAASFVSVLQNLALLGIGTNADGTNPFSAKLNKALWTARNVAEGGDGDLRYTLNKETGTDVLSLLLQTGFSGRAEIGLIGDDDLLIKVSADGSAWKDALRINKSSGILELPQGTSWSREKLAANRTYHVNAATGSDSNTGLTGGTAFASIQKAVDVVAGIDMAGFSVTINVAAGSYAGFNCRPIVGGNVSIIGDEVTPANVVVAGTADHAVECENSPGGVWLIVGLKLTATSIFNGIMVGAGSSLQFRNIDFGTAIFHMQARNGGLCEAVGNYTISAGANRHMSGNTFGTMRVQGRTVTLTGTPAFAQYFAEAVSGLVVANGNTYSGSATGPRYSVTLNGVINTASGGASYFPGNSAGAAATGGQYA